MGQEHGRERMPDKSLLQNKSGQQILPVNVFEADSALVITAPLPGVEPENIVIDVAGNKVTIKAELRGPGQERRRYVQREWSYGDYMREVELPVAVDAEHSNASFGNGVLTLTLPKASSEQQERIVLDQTHATEGHRKGHVGHSTIVKVQEEKA